MPRLTSEQFGQIATFSPKTQRQIFSELGRVEFEKCADSPLYWLDVSQHPCSPQYPDGIPYAFTRDPHLFFECNTCHMEVLPKNRGLHLQEAHGRTVSKIKELDAEFSELPAVRPFPDYLYRAYMVPLIEHWTHAQYFAVEKTRDMMATWLMMCLHTWDVLFHRGRQVLYQSQTAPKTLELVQRSALHR